MPTCRRSVSVRHHWRKRIDPPACAGSRTGRQPMIPINSGDVTGRRNGPPGRGCLSGVTATGMRVTDASSGSDWLRLAGIVRSATQMRPAGAGRQRRRSCRRPHPDTPGDRATRRRQAWVWGGQAPAGARSLRTRRSRARGLLPWMSISRNGGARGSKLPSAVRRAVRCALHRVPPGSAHCIVVLYAYYHT
jgi:hypothetical protein